MLLTAAMLLSTAAAAQRQALMFRSTDGNYWKMAPAEVAAKVVGTPQVVIRADRPNQTFKGWGTCFNELDYDAYGLMTEEDRLLFVKRAFNPHGDLRFTVGRIPVGASDYARDWYSCNETDGDFDMKNFSIERDREAIIPSVRLAQAECPGMTFWASPWSPPQWMKTNKHYAQRQTSTNGCPFSVAPYFNDQFIDDTRYYDAYCLYLGKFVEAYKAEGIGITSLAYQNEAYSFTPYPGCSWTAKTTGKFLANHLGPYFAEHHPEVSLIVGTMNTGSLDVFEEILNTPGVEKYCKQIGFQWEGANAMTEVLTRHPGYEAVMTENECGSGTFDWNAAAHTFYLINRYLANRVTTYTYWNAILKDKGVSTWGWQQNALVQVNSATGTPRYTAEYYAFKHYSHLIPPGSKILTVDEPNLVLSAQTPTGAIVVVAGNTTGTEKTLTMDVDGSYLTATLPANSFTSYVVGDDEAMRQLLLEEAMGLADIERAALTEEQRRRLDTAISLGKSGNEGCVDSLEQAVAKVIGMNTPGETAHSAIENANFTGNANGWKKANTSNGGDFRTNTVAGKTCWNSWSNDFTSMDVYQELSGLEPGAYRLSCLSMCGPGEITDQHAYLMTKGDTAVSPAKKVAIWNTAEGWERQTTEKIIVGTDGKLRAGYASTSGGGTKGWFCVTGFELTRVEMGENDTIPVYEDRPSTDLYNKVKAEAETLADDETYAAEARQQLRDLIDEQTALLPQLSRQTEVDDLARQLQQAMVTVRLTQRPGESTSFTFAISNAGAEGEAGWVLSLTNGDAKIKSGQHYSGDSRNTYFDSYNATAGNLWYTGHQTLSNLPNGTYRLAARSRSDGEGVFVTAQTASQYLTTEVAANGNTGGTLGNGWERYTIDGIDVTDGVLTIGFTNDMYLTGKKFTGTWLSADDFELFYISDKTATAIAQPGADNTWVRGGKGCIAGDVSAIYRTDGSRVSGSASLPAGIYIVKGRGKTAKVIVK